MRKKILLVNPYIEDFSAYDHFSKPLGLIWLASYLRKFFEVRFVNVLRRNHPVQFVRKFKLDGTGDFPKRVIKPPEILADIPREFKRYGVDEEIFIQELKDGEIPDYIFVTSGMTYWYTGLKYTIEILRNVFPNAKIIVGGIYPSIIPSHAEKYIDADFVVPSQRLGVVLRLLGKYLNVSFDDDFILPAYDLLGEYYYLPLLTSTGCFFNCSYCIGHRLSDFRQFDPMIFVRAVEELYTKYGCRHFVFYDDALLVNSKRHIDVFLRGVAESGLPIKFYTPNGLHIKFIDLETAILMKNANFVDLRLSLESVNEKFHEESDKKTRTEEFLNAISILYKAGFERKNIKVYLLLNLPGQDYYEVERGMEFVYKNGAIPKLAFYSPIPGTPDFEKAKLITNVDEPLFQNNTVYLYRSGFNMEFYQHLKRLEKKYSV